MSVRKCLECKYFKKPEGRSGLGDCELNNSRTFTYDSCSDFTDKNTPSPEAGSIQALEERVAQLERLVMRLL